MHQQNGAIEITLLATILLLLTIGAAQSHWMLSASLLFRDHQIAEQSEQIAIEAAQSSMQGRPFAARELRCNAGSSHSAIPRTIFYCAKAARQIDSLTAAINFDHIFARAVPCPINRAPTLTSRSIFLCDSITDSGIVKGDLVSPTINQQQHRLIAASGSIVSHQLRLSGNLYLLALGEITIESVSNMNEAGVTLFLFAPRGRVTIGTLDNSVSIGSWPETVPLPTLAHIPLGLFAQAFGITP